MNATVGFFYAEPLQSGYTIRAGKASLPLNPDEVAGVLPVLVRTPIAARGLTDIIPYPNLLSAMLSQGWQGVNFLYEGGAWHEVLDMLGNCGERLDGPAGAADSQEEVKSEYATEKQIEAVERMTSSHQFDQDREAIRRSMRHATLEQASKLYEYVKNGLETRPRLYPKGGRAAYLRSLSQGQPTGR